MGPLAAWWSHRKAEEQKRAAREAARRREWEESIDYWEDLGKRVHRLPAARLRSAPRQELLQLRTAIEQALEILEPHVSEMTEILRDERNYTAPHDQKMELARQKRIVSQLRRQETRVRNALY